MTTNGTATTGATPSEELGAHYLETVTRRFEATRRLGEKALDQVPDELLCTSIDAESNSLAVLVRHLAGNMRSRWTDVLTTDGEKPDRDRDAEFEPPAPPTRDELLARWREGWDCLFAALGNLGPGDLLKIVVIRGEDHTVVQAIERQLEHYAYHVGQMVFLAKHLAHRDWKTLSVARGKSAEYWPGRKPGGAGGGSR